MRSFLIDIGTRLEQCASNLLKANADPNKATNNGYTALMLSCQNGHTEVSCSAPSPSPSRSLTLSLAAC